MKTVTGGILLILVALLGSCGGSGSSNEPLDDNGSTDGGTTDGGTTDGGTTDGPPTGSLINATNAHALLLQAFEIYSGRAYDDRLNRFPYDLGEDAECANDGETTQSDSELSFDNCAIAGETVSGQVNQTISSAGIDRNFADFLVEFGGEGQMSVSGRHFIACCTPVSDFSTNDLDYRLAYSGGTLQVSSATTYQRIEAEQGLMGGSFSMDPPAVSGHTFDVSTSQDFVFNSGANLTIEEMELTRTQWLFEIGEMSIRAEDGSSVEINADTGDEQTLSIMIVNAEGESISNESWGDLAEAFRYSPGAQLGSFTRENSISIINEVFAHYSGQGYVDVLHSLPGYSDERYVSGPDFRPPERDLEGFGEPVYVDCSAGGSAEFTPIWEDFFRFTRYGWFYSFSDCVDGENTLRGTLFNDSRSSIYTYDTQGLSKELPDRVINLSGMVVYNPYGVYGCEDCKFWNSENLQLSVDASVDNQQIVNGNTRFTYNGPGYRLYSDMSGAVSIKSAATDGQWVHASVLDDFELQIPPDDPAYTDVSLQNFATGTIQLRSDSGDTLTLVANNGDVRTADVRLDSPGLSTQFTQDWSVWHDNLLPVTTHAPVSGL